MRAIVVVFGQSGCIRVKSCCIRARWFYSVKVVVIGQKWFYFEKSSFIRQKWLYLGNVVVFRNQCCVREKVIVL